MLKVAWNVGKVLDELAGLVYEVDWHKLLVLHHHLEHTGLETLEDQLHRSHRSVPDQVIYE